MRKLVLDAADCCHQPFEAFFDDVIIWVELLCLLEVAHCLWKLLCNLQAQRTPEICIDILSIQLNGSIEVFDGTFMIFLDLVALTPFEQRLDVVWINLKAFRE